MSSPNQSCKLIIKRVNNKITSYFPPSPHKDDGQESDEVDDAVQGAETIEKDCEAGSPLPQDVKQAIPTPDSTPTKDKIKDTLTHLPHSPHTIQLLDNYEDDGEDSKENRAQNRLKKEKQSEEKAGCDSPRPTQAKQIKAEPSPVRDTGRLRRGRSGKSRSNPGTKGASKISTSTTATKARPPKPKTTKAPTKAAPKSPAPSNYLLTDYFPIRRSSRKTSTDIKKERQAGLEKAILEDCTDGLEVVQITGKGRGVIATKAFRKGDFVVEYTGELISPADAKEREKKYAANPDFGCYMYYFTHNNKSYCIDATAETGKLGRLLNHSCKSPNCTTKVVPIDGTPYLILIALQDISVNEELLYDYGDRSKESLAAHPWLAE